MHLKKSIQDGWNMDRSTHLKLSTRSKPKGRDLVAFSFALLWRYNVLENVKVVTVFDDTIFLFAVLAENGSVAILGFPRAYRLDGLFVGEIFGSSSMDVFDTGNGQASLRKVCRFSIRIRPNFIMVSEPVWYCSANEAARYSSGGMWPIDHMALSVRYVSWHSCTSLHDCLP